MTDEEYLSRPLLEGVEYCITEDLIKITSDHTEYINLKRFIPLDIESLLERYDEVRQMAKKRKAKISYKRHLRKKILENRDEYRKDCLEAQRLFESMTAVAKEIQKRGLHFGTTDDTVLKKLCDYKALYLVLFGGNRSISAIRDIKTALDASLNLLLEADSAELIIYM